MGVWVSGDIHSEPKRFNTRNFPDQLEFLEENKDENIVIVTGDFGVIWQWDGGTLDAADPLWKEKAKALRDDD